jgi:GNAT superfamily N-acetyltransferase
LVINIRRAGVDDKSAIAAIKLASWPGETADTIQIANAMSEGTHVTHVAENEVVVVGFVDGFLTMSIDRQRRWEVDLLAVHPDFQRLGIASRLVEATTQVARDAGAVLSRGLVHVENSASQGTFARCGYHLDEKTCGLYVASESENRAVAVPITAHLISVNTFNYRGLWLEGELTPASFAAANAIRTCSGWDVAGALIPLHDENAVNAAVDAGWQQVGHYQWWCLSCSASGQL